VLQFCLLFFFLFSFFYLLFSEFVLLVYMLVVSDLPVLMGVIERCRIEVLNYIYIYIERVFVKLSRRFMIHFTYIYIYIYIYKGFLHHLLLDLQSTNLNQHMPKFNFSQLPTQAEAIYFEPYPQTCMCRPLIFFNFYSFSCHIFLLH
jgi:hypothetical protein